MPSKRSQYLIAWILLLTASALFRLAIAFYWDARVRNDVATLASTTNQDGPFFFGDSDSYWKLGRALAFGRPYQFDPVHHWQVFRTPGYPAILAPLFWIFGENPPVFAARLLGVLFGVVNVGLVGVLAFALFAGSESRKPIALIAGFCAAFDPTLAFQSVCVLSEEPFLTFALLLSLTIYRVAQKLSLLPSPGNDLAPSPSLRLDGDAAPNLRDAVLLAAFSTATIYIRPSSLYFLPFVALVLVACAALRQRRLALTFRGFKRFALLALAVACLHVAFLSPWIARNYALTGRFVATSLQGGASLYDGLNPTATGASNMDFVDQIYEDELRNPSNDESVHIEVRLDARLKKAAVDWAKARPAEALKLAAVKFYRLWSPIPREEAFARPLFALALACSFLPVFALGLCGAIRSFRRKGAAWFLLIFPIYVTCLHVVFVSSIRYRVPCLPFFDVLTGYFLVTLWNSRRA